MTQRLLLSLQIVLVALAAQSCRPEHSSESDTVAASSATAGTGASAGSTYHDTLELVSIGGEPLKSRDESAHQCDQRPFLSLMLFSDARWTVRDSLFIDCPSPRGGGQLFGRLSTGTIELRGDTIVFLSDEPSEGENGVVFVGIREDSAVRVLRADEEGRDYVYRRMSPR